MITAAAFLGSAAGSFLVWSVLKNSLSTDRFTHENFRGQLIPTVAGVAVVVVAAIGSMLLLGLVPPEDLAVEASFGAFQLTLGFGVLGFFDDVAAKSGDAGFVGHLRALRAGRVTTGFVKLAGGVVVAILAAGLVTSGGVSGWFRDAALIAAGANLANLFDRAPGRTVKVAGLVSIAMVVAVGMASTMAFAAMAVGAGLGIAWWEMREKAMLGDTGVNVIGALVALSAVTSLDSTTLWVAAAVVVVMNLLSEFVSFSKVIDSVGPLRVIDRFARPNP